MLRDGIYKCALKTWHACWEKPRQSTGVLIREMKRFSAREFLRGQTVLFMAVHFQEETEPETKFN